MKKWMVALLAALLLWGCTPNTAEQMLATQPQTEIPMKYRIEIIGEYDPENSLEDAYYAGELVRLVLGNITEHYYTVTVNGTDCAPDEEASNLTYEIFSFIMPAEDVQVLIEGHHVDIPTLPPETEPPILQPEPADADFVNVKHYLPGAVIRLAYATEDNFTGQKIYDFETCWLRYGTVKKLIFVQEQLQETGLTLLIWDGFRPAAAQWKLWEVCPDPTFVANPKKGFSSHSRGNTVDISLAYADGTEVVMPTGFDDFSALADRDYRDCTPEAAENAAYLEGLMEEAGFKPYTKEWWHFTDTQSYPVEEVFCPVAEGWYLADCEEYISLWARPDTAAEVITRINPREEILVVGQWGDFALVEYGNLTGFVLQNYLCPAN